MPPPYTPFVKQQTVLRSPARRFGEGAAGSNAKFVLAVLCAHQHHITGICDPPLRDLESATGFSRTTLQRALAALEGGGYARRVHRSGGSYSYQLLVDQLMLTDTPRVPVDPPRVAARKPRGHTGRFLPAALGGNPGQIDLGDLPRSAPDDLEFSTGVSSPGEVKSTWGSGQIDLGSGQIDRGTDLLDQERKSECAPAGAVERSGDRPKERPVDPELSPLPIAGVAMTAAQREAAAQRAADDGNHRVLFMSALHIGRDRDYARQFAAVPIEEEADLLEATKRAAEQSSMRYDLVSTDGARVLHEAVGQAWRVLVRSGALKDRSEEIGRQARRRARR